MAHPEVPFVALDTLWLQIGGTICNLRCTHCFISCAPDNHRHEMMSLEEVRRSLDQAVRLGVREYYFTGGEPFMNRDLFPILEETLRVGPATVLTNGLFLDPDRSRRLRALADASDYSLDIRISLDGWGSGDHDRIRGPGTFRRAMEGARNLWATRLNPVITVSEAAEAVGSAEGRLAFLEILRDLGLTRPRLKVLALFRMGEEEKRSRGYAFSERLDAEDLGRDDLEALQCSSGRMVTSRGVYVCPLLIDEPRARMGASLTETLRPFELAYGSCYTCHVTGVTCRT
jgi:AdoMet-dependent heme synthase